jgi:hypothetical protein
MAFKKPNPLASQKPQAYGTSICHSCQETMEFAINADFVRNISADVECFKCHRVTQVQLNALDPFRVKLAKEYMLSGDPVSDSLKAEPASTGTNTNSFTDGRGNSGDASGKSTLYEQIRLGSGKSMLMLLCKTRN